MVNVKIVSEIKIDDFEREFQRAVSELKQKVVGRITYTTNVLHAEGEYVYFFTAYIEYEES